MKAKHVITTFVFATAMVFGAATTIAANHNVRMASAEADFDVYLLPNDNWKSDGARFAAYLFDGSSPATWVDLTKVGETDYYTAKIDKTAYPKIIFGRMNPGTTENNWTNKWNQTGDLVIPTDGKNLFTVPSASWDGATTTWSVYGEEPTPEPDPEYYLAGSMNSWAKAEGYVLAESEEPVPEGFAKQFVLNDIELEADATFKVTDGGHWFGFNELESNDNFTSEEAVGGPNIKVVNAGQYDVYLKIASEIGNSKIYIHKDGGEPTPEPDFPEDAGYYICGSANEWVFKTAPMMVEEADEDGNIAHKFEFTAAADDEIRVRYYNPGTSEDVWATCGTETAEFGSKVGDNFKFSKETGSYDIYAKYVETALYFFVAEHPLPPEPVSENKNTYYLKDAAGALGDEPHAYAWTEGHFTPEYNAAFPGEKMTVVSAENKIYSIEVSETYENILFANKEGTAQTANLLTAAHAGWRFELGEGTEGNWVTDTVYTYTLTRGDTPVAEDVELANNPGNPSERQSAATVELQVNDILTFAIKDGAAVNVSAKDGTKVANTADGLKVVEAGNETLYLDIAENKLWAGDYTFADGTYLRGTDGNWGSQYQITMVESDDDNYQVMAKGLVLDKDHGFKALFHDEGQEDRWVEPGEVYSDHNEEFPVSIKGGNVAVEKSGNYDLYINTNNSENYKYYLVAKDYVEPVYTVSYDGNQYPLTEGHTEDLDLVAGKTVSILKDGVASDINAELVGNNNIDADGKIIVNAHAKVYVNADSKTFFVGSDIQFGGYHLLVGNSFVALNDYDDFDEYKQRRALSVEFKEGDEIRVIDTTKESGVGLSVIWSETNFDVAEDLADKFAVEEGKLVVKADVTTDVYLKLKFEANRFWFGDADPAVTAAAAYAKLFNEAMEETCIYDPDKDVPLDIDAYRASVKDKWDELKEAYADVAPEAKEILQHATKDDGNNDIKKFAEKYDSIYTLRGATYGLENFVERSFSSNDMVVVNNEFNSTALIVLLISVSCAFAFTGFLFIKRKVTRK